MRINYLLIFFNVIALTLSGQAQNRKSFFDTLSTANKVHLKLTLPLDSLHKAQRETVSGRITVTLDDKILFFDEPLGLELRGKFRRMKCHDMPPLALNLKKSMLRKVGLKDYDKYKLVTHCLDEPDSAENLQEEHLCYKLYNQLTDFSFRILYISISYCDSSGDRDCINHVALIIESDDDLERRMKVEESERINVNADSLDKEHYSKIAAFNCLIGNKDWSIQSLRNCKIFYSELKQKFIPVPYDFDYSNIVAPRYRRETSSENTNHPFDRTFQGEYFQSISSEMLPALLPYEQRLLDVVKNDKTGLRRGRKEQIRNYLNSAFIFIRRAKSESLVYGTTIPYMGELQQ